MVSLLDMARAAAARQQAQRGVLRQQVQRGVLQSPLRQMMLQRAAAQRAAAPAPPLEAQKERVKQKLEARYGRKKSGGGGGLGSVLGKAANVVLKPLGVLDYGRGFVVSGVNELADALDRNPNTRASWGEFVQQGKDRMGFGDAIAMRGGTGNKWVDRALGFAGDVLLDPLTYITAGAGTALKGAAGRAALATKSARELGGTVARGELDDLIRRIGQKGVYGMTPAERRALGVADPAIRFAGKPIPGTQRIAQAGGEALAALRRPFTDTALGRAARALGAGRDPLVRPAVNAIATGQGDMVDAANTLRALAARSTGEREFALTHGRQAEALGRKYRGRSDLIDEIEAKAYTGEALSEEAAELANAFRTLGLSARSRGLEGLTLRQGYAGPQIMTDAFKEFLGRAEVKGNMFVRAADAASGRTKGRRFRGGTFEVNGKQITLPENPTRRQIERAFQDAFPELRDVKLFEDDPEYLLARSVEDLAQDVGRVASFREGERGARYTFAKGADEAYEDVLDVDATRIATSQRVRELQRSIDRTVNQVRSEADRLWRKGDRVQREAARLLRAAADNADEALRGSEDALRKLDAQLAELAGRRAGVESQYDALLQAADEARRRIRRSVAPPDRVPGSTLPSELASRTIPESYQRAMREGVNRQRREGADRAEEALRQIDAETFKLRGARLEGSVATEQLRQRAQELRKRANREAKRTGKARGRGKPAAIAAELRAEAERLDALVEAASQVGGREARALQALAFDYHQRVSGLLDSVDKLADDKAFLRAARTGMFDRVITKRVRDGFEELGRDLLGEGNEVAVQREIVRALENVEKALDQDPNAFWRAVDAYTRFFKSWATATPGFHVRNAMSAAFMNAVAGVSPKSMVRGARLWHEFMANANKDSWWMKLPAEDQEVAQKVIEAVAGTGTGGQFSAAELAHSTRKTRGRVERVFDRAGDTRVNRVSRKAGESVEGMMRAGMAYDTLIKGGSVDEAIARIRRYHFDYSEANELDQMMRRLIPFWTFMSRNVPLQVQEMWTNPRMYAHYNSLVRNMQADSEDPMPKGLAERGAWRITDGIALAPDLPHLRVAGDAAKFTDPMRLLSNANPALRVPAELLAGRNFYSDWVLDRRPEELTWDMAFLDLLGLTDEAGDGTTVVDQRIPYAIRNLVPPAGWVQRLLGGNEYYQDKRASSWLNWFGLPVQQITPSMLEREQRRLQREQQRAGMESEYARLLREFAAS